MGEEFQAEVERIKEVYTRFETEGRDKKIWAPFAESEASFRARQIIMFSFLMRKAGLIDLRGMRILDVGCGLGRHLRMFLDMGARPEDLWGIDISERSINTAKYLSPNLHFSTCNGWDIDFPDNNFDLITQFVVYSSIKNKNLQKQLTDEIIRVLHPGGHFFWWDMIYMAQDAGGQQVKLDPTFFLPGMAVSSIQTGMQTLPSETIRRLHGLSKIIGPFLDPLAHHRTHLAALFGPK